MNSMNMSRDLIAGWQPQHELLFGRHAIKVGHGLAESGLFTREALGKLIERCPRHELGLESMCVAGGMGQAMIVERLN